MNGCMNENLLTEILGVTKLMKTSGQIDRYISVYVEKWTDESMYVTDNGPNDQE